VNTAARKHLDKAAGFVAKGEGFYRKAAEEIGAAQEADSTLTQRQIGAAMGCDPRTIRDIIRWAKDGGRVPTPYSGKDHADNRAASHAKRVLKTAPLEQVEQIIAALPAERQQAIAGAAGNAYHAARQDYRETERSLTPTQRKEREAAGRQLAQPAKNAAAGFAALGIVGHLEQATEELRELVADGSLSARLTRQIDKASEAWLTEFEFAKQMAGESE
jgi:hypothetical protein